MNRKFLIIGLSILISLIAIFLIYRIIVNVGVGKNISAIRIDEETALSNKAKKLIDEGDEDGAIKELEMVIEKYPDSSKTESAYLSLASLYEKRNQFLKAKDLYQKTLEKFPDSNNILKLQEALDNVSIRLLFSSIITTDSFTYEVQKGDTLAKIAKKFDTTKELVQKANDIKDSVIKIGKKLKISKAQFSIVVDKSQNILTLKSDGNIVKTYRVSTGENFSTPTGTFKITNKIIDPPWYPPNGGMIPAGDPKNILGSRWLGLSKPSYGIHGTNDPKTIGKQVTAGCIRMMNPEVEELYAIVPEGIEVIIVD